MMRQQLRALQAEILKNKHSNILWATFVAFALAPVMGGVFILIVQDADALARAGGLAAKARAMNFAANWQSYFDILTQAVGVGGVLIFGFVASWIFGREYSDGTVKDLLALPVSRTAIVNAKFAVYGVWCLALAVGNLLVALVIGVILHLPFSGSGSLVLLFANYCITTVLTTVVGIPTAFFALWGRGYLAPLGFVALALVFAQIVAATGYGSYFPWSVPGLYSGAGGEYRQLLDGYSYAVLMLAGVVGYAAAVVYWNRADHTA